MGKVEFNGNKGLLIIHDLKVDKKEVVEFIGNFEEDKWEETILEILDLGVKSFKSFLTENYGSLIDNHFDLGISQFDGEVKEKVSYMNKNLFDPFIENANKQIVEKLTKDFDEKKEKFLKEIDERKEKIGKDVLSKFMTDFTESSNKFLQEILKFVTEKEVKGKTTLKGKDFEDYVFELSCEAGNAFGDYVEHIGVDDDTGDILAKNEGDSLSLCIEAKDKTMQSEPAINAVFGEIEERRGVDHSMVVFRSTSQIPQKMGPFKLYGTNRMVLTLSEEDEETKPYLFKVAYRILRSLTRIDNDERKVANVDVVLERVNGIRISLKKISSMKGKITTFSQELRSELDTMKGEIETRLEEIEEDLESTA